MSLPRDTAKDPVRATAAMIAAAVRSRAITARAVAQAHLARIELLDQALGAFTTLTATRALAEADAVDATIAAGRDPGPLAGVPYGVKNLFDLAGVTTLAGAKINQTNPPASADAVLVQRLHAAGAVCVGALNMGEYAYDFTGENAHFGASRNPHDPRHMSGGSSGGSGTAVAAGFAPLALGSDTNGSIRVPASLCGVFGLKPTFGRLPRSGSFPFVASLDHVGPLARSAQDLALAYDAMQGADAGDASCTRATIEPVSASLAHGVQGLRIATAGGHFARGGMPEAFAAVERVARALGATTSVELPQAHRARAAAFIITTSEGAALHLDRLRNRPQDFDPEVRDRLIAGAMLPASYVAQAQKFRRWYRDEVLRLFDSVDLILAPATPVRAPIANLKTMVIDGVEMPVRPNLGLYTQPISFIGLPVVAVPLFMPRLKLPIGVQIIAAPWREDLALRAAAFLESAGVCEAPVAERT
jgi:AtzE family amidohydrolase